MIDKTILFLTDRLNGHFAGRFSGSGSIAVPSDLRGEDDSVGALDNRIILSLITVELDRAARNVISRPAEGAVTRVRAPMPLSLLIMISANFPGNYVEGLRLLSASLGFFQANPVLSRQGAPDLPDGLDRVVFELQNLDLQSLTNLWSNFGGRHLPSILVRAGIVTIQEDQVIGGSAIVQEIEIDT